MFPPTSRYHEVEIARKEMPDGREVVYLRRRFAPAPPDAPSVLAEHTVTEGDRLDNVAAKYLGDPVLFWSVADANNAMRPEELTDEIGRSLKIALPDF